MQPNTVHIQSKDRTVQLQPVVISLTIKLLFKFNDVQAAVCLPLLYNQIFHSLEIIAVFLLFLLKIGIYVYRLVYIFFR